MSSLAPRHRRRQHTVVLIWCSCGGGVGQGSGHSKGVPQRTASFRPPGRTPQRRRGIPPPIGSASTHYRNFSAAQQKSRFNVGYPMSAYPPIVLQNSLFTIAGEFSGAWPSIPKFWLGGQSLTRFFTVRGPEKRTMEFSCCP